MLIILYVSIYGFCEKRCLAFWGIFDQVRSQEDGFLGSWHSGVVINCEELVRVVQYDHLLSDDGSDKLVEKVKVTPEIDGVFDQEIKRHDEYRGLIRPSTESSGVLREWNLHYGACVDLFYEEAWWEGVIFDHEDGSEKRRIFFPDMGDEMEGGVDELRLSKDCDAVTEEWRPRGNWLFLELIEELEQDWPLLVSVKQMWYDVRMKHGFAKLREWTSSRRDIWKDLILQVLYDNLKVAVQHLFAELNSSCRSTKPGKTLLKFSEKTFDSVLKPEGFFHSSHAVITLKAILQSDVNDESNNQVQKQDDQIPTSDRHANEQTPTISISSPASTNYSHDPDEDSGISSDDNDESPSTSSQLPRGKHKKSTQKSRLKWQLAVPRLIPGPEYFPDAIEECNEFHRVRKNPPKALMLKANKYLLHLGWKIEYAHDVKYHCQRKRFSSPDGDLFFSFRMACLSFDDDFKLGPNYGIVNSVSSCVEAYSTLGKTQASSEFSESCIPSRINYIEPEYCPEAVRDYHLFASSKCYQGKEAKKKAMKAKKHLSAIGWSFYYHQKEHSQEMRYLSPDRTVFYSLVTACKWCLEAGALSPVDPSSSSMGSTGNLPLLENASFGTSKSSDMPMSEGFVQSIKGGVHKTRISRKRKKRESDCIIVSLPPKRGRKSGAPMRSKGDSNADSSTPMIRSSKRVRDRVCSSSQQIPRTILSWLIDNNVVLPRAKVLYCCGKNGPRKAEGRISREGIKCSCCGGIFSLSGFEAHAGSCDHRPSSNIFLEDGRSLLDCQWQLKQRDSSHFSKLERQQKGNQHNRKNDYICSVCHYGGELVLCDFCPSSFHTHCLGLKVSLLFDPLVMF